MDLTEDPAPRRLDAIAELVELSPTGGIRVELSATGSPPADINAHIDLTAYRIVQQPRTCSPRVWGRGTTHPHHP